MEYQEMYHGREIIITTYQQGARDWKAKAELRDAGTRLQIGEEMKGSYATEEQARRAALSVAAGAIDLLRVSTGKL